MRFLKHRDAEKMALRQRPSNRAQRAVFIAGGLAASLGLLAAGGAWLTRAGLAAAAMVAIDAHAARAGKSLGLTVENVSVVGRERADRQAILTALGVARGTPILGVDLGAAKARLEALPWIKSAEVERLLPDTLFVRLAERHPLALWQRQGKLSLVADDGAELPGEKLDSYGSLIVLVGDDAPKLGAPLLAMLASEPALYPHVAAAVRVGGRRWNLRLDNGIDIALPDDDPAAAWHRLAQLDREQSLLERNVLAVDMRLPDRLVLRLPPEPAKVPPPKKGKPGNHPA
ncbi:MAG TPA: FtsQ-type POTRA domain-containing protein [Stellaceae bacterium]|nr:FtsQ-type POTRA domain-containing protein [Stellaceae bacterium]